jgi:uncharacterized protein YlxW (UPF0749 family)
MKSFLENKYVKFVLMILGAGVLRLLFDKLMNNSALEGHDKIKEQVAKLDKEVAKVEGKAEAAKQEVIDLNEKSKEIQNENNSNLTTDQLSNLFNDRK